MGIIDPLPKELVGLFSQKGDIPSQDAALQTRFKADSKLTRTFLNWADSHKELVVHHTRLLDIYSIANTIESEKEDQSIVQKVMDLSSELLLKLKAGIVHTYQPEDDLRNIFVKNPADYTLADRESIKSSIDDIIALHKLGIVSNEELVNALSSKDPKEGRSNQSLISDPAIFAKVFSSTSIYPSSDPFSLNPVYLSSDLSQLLQHNVLHDLIKNLATGETSQVQTFPLILLPPEVWKELLNTKNENGDSLLKAATANIHTLATLYQLAPSAVKAELFPLYVSGALSRELLFEFSALKIPNHMPLITDGSFLRRLLPLMCAYPEKLEELMPNFFKEIVRSNLPLEMMPNPADMQRLRMLPGDLLHKWVTKTDADGLTPLHHAMRMFGDDRLKFLHALSPKGFKAALQIGQGYEDKAKPLLYAAKKNDVSMMDFLISIDPNPSYIVEPELPFNTLIIVILDRLQRQLPSVDGRISSTFKSAIDLLEAIQMHHTMKDLGHAWHLAGSAKVERRVDSVTFPVRLEGGYRLRRAEPGGEERWQRAMHDDLSTICDSYPNLLTPERKELLLDAMQAASVGGYATPIERVLAGLPTFLQTGYTKHSVIVLIWGDQFIICNRGGGMRYPIESFHFDKSKISSEDISDILNCRYKEKKDYNALLFEILPNKLNFTKTELNERLDSALILPPQIVGNCSWVSLTTAVFALMLLAGVKEAQAQLSSTPVTLPDVMNAEVERYRTWLAFQQILMLERSILPLQNKEALYRPDHQSIVEGLRRAHMLILDETCQHKLDELTNIYVNTLDDSARTTFNTDKQFWVTRRFLVTETLSPETHTLTLLARTWTSLGLPFPHGDWLP